MMKRTIALIAALVLCMSFACSAFAAEDTFVPSIGYKDGPEIDKAVMDGEDVTACLEVTSISEAEEQSTDITQDERDLLLDVYGDLSDDSMKLPLEDGSYVVRELVDVSFRATDCVGEGDGHKEKLAQPGVTISVDFDLGVKADTDVKVLVYINGEWVFAESVTNNGDGTVTVVLEDICPVAFCVEEGAEEVPPYTGIAADRNLVLWIAVMAVSLASMIVLMVQRRKNGK